MVDGQGARVWVSVGHVNRVATQAAHPPITGHEIGHSNVLHERFEHESSSAYLARMTDTTRRAVPEPRVVRTESRPAERALPIEVARHARVIPRPQSARDRAVSNTFVPRVKHPIARRARLGHLAG